MHAAPHPQLIKGVSEEICFNLNLHISILSTTFQQRIVLYFHFKLISLKSKVIVNQTRSKWKLKEEVIMSCGRNNLELTRKDGFEDL